MSCTCQAPGFCSRFGYKVSLPQWKWCKGELQVSPETEQKFLNSMKPIEKPQTLKLILKFLVSLIKYMQSGWKNVSDEEYRKRGMICMRCPYVQFQNNMITCSICGCNIKVKAKWEIMDCPKDFWRNNTIPLSVIPPARAGGGCGCGH